MCRSVTAFHWERWVILTLTKLANAATPGSVKFGGQEVGYVLCCLRNEQSRGRMQIAVSAFLCGCYYLRQSYTYLS